MIEHSINKLGPPSSGQAGAVIVEVGKLRGHSVDAINSWQVSGADISGSVGADDGVSVCLCTSAGLAHALPGRCSVPIFGRHCSRRGLQVAR